MREEVLERSFDAVNVGAARGVGPSRIHLGQDSRGQVVTDSAPIGPGRTVVSWHLLVAAPVDLRAVLVDGETMRSRALVLVPFASVPAPTLKSAEKVSHGAD